MKRFFSRLLRFFWSWSFLKFVLFAITLVVLFYVEEDWRGARELAAVKTRWQAANLSLNPADYYPPPVPDNQNLAALPVFREEPVPQDHGVLEAVRLREATEEDKHGGSLVDYNEKKRQLPELVVSAYGRMFPGKTPPASSVAQLEELYPILVELRNAAPARPAFRVNQDYAHQPSWDRPMGLIAGQIPLARLLRYHGELALRENQPQAALDDIRIALQIARGVAKDPSLVGGLVSIGVVAITRSNIDRGLKTKAWSDAQLAQLQDDLRQVDFLTLYQFDMHGEVATFSLPMYEWLKIRPFDMGLIVGIATGTINQGGDNRGTGTLPVWRLWARGWWDMNAARMADFVLREAGSVDPKARSVDLKCIQQLEIEVDKAREFPGVLAPWNNLFAVSAVPVTGAIEKFVQGQVQFDEDFIVCGLERYRLAHNAYPPNLSALVPTYLDKLPPDLINGESYHYRLNTEGGFLLYSVGWNRVDDGGKIVTNPEHSKFIDFDQGDWVWPMFKW